MLEIYELLDRFELLNPTNSKLSDLRRSYIDRDLSSIFRLTNADEDLRKAVIEQNLHSVFRLLPNIAVDDVEDLRKAVMEQNLHSIFRLLKDDDFRKLILEDNTWKLWPVLERYKSTQFIAAFKNFFVNDMSYNKDCFSRGQLQSKLWLVSELKKLNLDLGTIFLCAGWYATLAVMLFESEIKIDKIRSFDIDKSTADIAEIFNKPWVKDNWRFKASVEDILSIDYNTHLYKVRRSDNTICDLHDTPSTIINTSCEHIENFSKWYDMIPTGKLVVLQSNNYFEVDEHVNCSNSLSEFSKSCPMTTTLFEGELTLQKYKRFMKIGFK
jgi:hypothetical protein